MIDGWIGASGAEVTVPDGARSVDTTGAWVLPGFVDAHPRIGTIEEGVGPAGDDHDEATLPVTAQPRVIDAINLADMAFADAVAGGMLAVGVNPTSAT